MQSLPQSLLYILTSRTLFRLQGLNWRLFFLSPEVARAYMM